MYSNTSASQFYFNPAHFKSLAALQQTNSACSFSLVLSFSLTHNYGLNLVILRTTNSTFNTV